MIRGKQIGVIGSGVVGTTLANGFLKPGPLLRENGEPLLDDGLGFLGLAEFV